MSGRPRQSFGRFRTVSEFIGSAIDRTEVIVPVYTSRGRRVPQLMVVDLLAANIYVA